MHKNIYFHSGWAHYETAVPGKFKLVPPDSRIDGLRIDYLNMREMFFNEPVGFDLLMEALQVLENEINNIPIA